MHVYIHTQIHIYVHICVYMYIQTYVHKKHISYKYSVSYICMYIYKNNNKINKNYKNLLTTTKNKLIKFGLASSRRHRVGLALSRVGIESAASSWRHWLVPFPDRQTGRQTDKLWVYILDIWFKFHQNWTYFSFHSGLLPPFVTRFGLRPPFAHWNVLKIWNLPYFVRNTYGLNVIKIRLIWIFMWVFCTPLHPLTINKRCWNSGISYVLCNIYGLNFIKIGRISIFIGGLLPFCASFPLYLIEMNIASLASPEKVIWDPYVCFFI